MQEMQETQAQSLGQEDPPLEEGMVTHLSILAGNTPWTEVPGGLQSMGSQRVGHDRATEHRAVCYSQLFSITMNANFPEKPFTSSSCEPTQNQQIR